MRLKEYFPTGSWLHLWEPCGQARLRFMDQEHPWPMNWVHILDSLI